jgi:hypothetical protein
MARCFEQQRGAATPRVVLPGAVVAISLTAGALLALALVLAMRGDGPLILGLGDSDGQVRLPEGETVPPLRSATLPDGAPTLLLPSGVLVPAVDPSPGGGGLRGDTQVRPGAVRRRGTTRTTPTPAGTPAPASTRPTTTTRPVATPAPNPVAVKERGRGTPAPQPVKVPTKRVAPRTPAPGVATPDPAPSAPVPTVELRPTQPSQPADTGVGADDGVLERVPAPTP